MATSNGNGYNTYILGTTKSATECLRILLYNKDVQPNGFPRITIRNIAEVTKELLRRGVGVVSLRRDINTEPFEYRVEDVGEGTADRFGWNVIIYLRNGQESESIGYTEFLNTQGERRNVDISLNFSTNISGDLITNISYSIGNNQPALDPEKFLGDNVWDYTRLEEIKKWKDKRNISPCLFSTHLSSFGNNKIESNIYMASMGTVIGKKKAMCNFHIARELDVDPYLVGFTHHYIDYYSGNDISVYSWSDDFKYSITSLSLSNRFGDPIRHVGQISDNGYETIPGKNGESLVPSQNIIKLWCGTYAMIENTKTGEISFYDTVGKKYLGSSYKGAFIDETTKHNNIISLGENPNFNSVLNLVPDLQNTWFNVKEYTKSFKIVSRKGSWTIFDLGNWYEFSNLRQTVRIDKSEFNNVFIINDLYLGLREKDEDGEEVFVIYKGLDKSYYSRTTQEIFSWKSNKVMSDPNNEQFVASVRRGDRIVNITEEEMNEEAYENGEKIKIYLNEEVDKTWLKYFKRNSYPFLKYPNVSEFIGSCSGVMFFLFENEQTKKKILNYI